MKETLGNKEVDIPWFPECCVQVSSLNSYRHASLLLEVHHDGGTAKTPLYAIIGNSIRCSCEKKQRYGGAKPALS